MYTYVCICVHPCVCAYMHACVRTCVRVHGGACAFTCAQMHVCIHACVCVRVCVCARAWVLPNRRRRSLLVLNDSLILYGSVKWCEGSWMCGGGGKAVGCEAPHLGAVYLFSMIGGVYLNSIIACGDSYRRYADSRPYKQTRARRYADHIHKRSDAM